MTDNGTEIGVATISYNEDGSVVKAEFSPTLAINCDDLLPQFQRLSGLDDLEAIEGNAGLLLGAWFEKLDTIELADREQFEIKTETVSCDRYESGNIRECKLRFVFKPIE